MLLQWKQNSFRLQLHKKSLARLSGLLLLVKNNWNNVIWDMESISGILQNYTDEEITWKLMSTKALMSVIFMTKNLHQSTNGQKMKHSILQDFLILFFVFVMLEFGTFVIFWRAWNSPFHLCQHEQFYARCSKSWSSYHVIFIKLMFEWIENY